MKADAAARLRDATLPLAAGFLPPAASPHSTWLTMPTLSQFGDARFVPQLPQRLAPKDAAGE